MEVNIRLKHYFAQKKAEPIRDVNQPQAPHRDEVYQGRHRLYEVGATYRLYCPTNRFSRRRIYYDAW